MSSEDELFDKLRERGNYYTYFFNKISSPKILSKLKEKGFLNKAPKAIRKDGYISYPSWAPANYLVKIADQAPEEVMKVILDIEPTDNQNVNGAFINAALKMPANVAKQIVPKTIEWLRDPNLHLIDVLASKLVKHLYDGGEKDEAIKLAKQLLIIQPPRSESEKAFGHPHARIGSHELNTFLREQLYDLFLDDPMLIAPLYINSLRAALEYMRTEEEAKEGVIEDYSEIWLSNFDTESNRSDPETVIAIRLYKSTKKIGDPSVKKQVIELILKEEFKTFKRMAVALIGPDSTDGGLKAVYDEFVEKYGNPIIENTLTSWTGPESPLSMDELRSMSALEIIEYANNWKPTQEIMAPSIRGLGYMLNQRIADEPEFGVDLLSQNTEIKKEYFDDIYRGLDQTAANKKEVDWQPVFAHVKKLAADLKVNLSEDDYTVVLAALRMLQSAADSDQVDLTSKDTRQLYLDLIEIGLQCNDPAKDKNEDPFEGSQSPDIGGLNTNRGVALFTLTHFMKRASRTTKGKNQLELFTESELKQIVSLLDAHVDPTKETSFAVRTVYAHDLPYLSTALPEWTTKSLDKIFPDQNKDYFRVNVETFITYSIMYAPLIPLMRPILIEYMKRVKNEAVKNVDSNVIEHLVAKLMAYYLRGDIELDNELITGLFALGSKWTAEAIEFVGRNLKGLDAIKEEDLFKRAQALWDWRSSNATAEENSNFGMWFICDGFDLEWRKNNFLNSLRNTTNTELLWQVFDWFLENAEAHPKITAELFDEIIRTQSDQILHFTLIRDVESLLEKLSTVDDGEIKKTLSSTVDKLLARNIGDYRKFKK